MHLLQYIHWDPDPSIFGLPFRWYGLLFASSFFFGYFIMNRFFKKEKVPENWLESLTIYMAVSTVVGARLGHCLFYDPEYYLSHPLDILKVWEGGLASHGAAIGIITGLYLWTKRVSKRNVLWILDRIVITVALSGLTIRLGNLMNSEILGKETTAAYGFVFPREDQSMELRAKWEGEKVQLEYRPEVSSQARQFDFYHSVDDSIYQRLPLAPVLIPPSLATTISDEETPLASAVKFTDAAPGTKGHIYYLSAEHSDKPALQASNGDSLHPRMAYFEDPFAPDKSAFAGRWESDRVHLHFDMRGLVQGPSTRGTLLLRSPDGENWTVIHRGTLGGGSAQAVLDTLDLPVGIANPHYRLLIKEDQSKLMARHPAQLYEAFAYTLIFVFLLWWYYRHDSKIPMGRFFGVFLILIFGMRILIEFTKEEQAEFNEGSFLNMGQLLSIPFVLAGIYFTVRSYLRPKFPDPIPAQPANPKAPGK